MMTMLEWSSGGLISARRLKQDVPAANIETMLANGVEINLRSPEAEIMAAKGQDADTASWQREK